MAKSRGRRAKPTRPERVEGWVSFMEVKAQVSMADILQHYGLLNQFRQKGDELVGLCPFHKEKRGSFHASITKNAWQCFGCKRKGNILDFVAAKEGVGIRQAGLMIQGWFETGVKKPAKAIPKVSETQGGFSESADSTDQRAVQDNPPLTFELKNLDTRHTYLLKDRGLKKETIELFGLGYCSRGLMKGRIAIPVYNEKGELVAYAGRWPGEPPTGTEKYLLPSGFAKSHVVFNLRQAQGLAKDNGLILVEGFFDVFWLHQCGFPQAVALMGSSLSEWQRELLLASLGPRGRIMLMLDNDEAGRQCETQCLEQLSTGVFIKLVRLPVSRQQPDNLTEPEIRQLLTGD